MEGSSRQRPFYGFQNFDRTPHSPLFTAALRLSRILGLWGLHGRSQDTVAVDPGFKLQTKSKRRS
ncbi:hypothetical protein BDZ97DRAFT_706395 [Flammula alnicola]|nr:hypothetical protein BDZ97DRAFT_706395 [Flammula alnicola]